MGSAQAKCLKGCFSWVGLIQYSFWSNRQTSVGVVKLTEEDISPLLRALWDQIKVSERIKASESYFYP